MKILALDTALNACSVAIMDADDICAHLHEKRRRGHAETLMPMVQSLMKKAELCYHDLDLIAVTVGPGTFTGLRIGLATARGIALAADKPIVGITSLEALAASVPREIAAGRPIVATADARRGEIYMQAFIRTDAADRITPMDAPMAVPIAEAYRLLPQENTALLGSGVPLLMGLPGFDADKYAPLDLDEDPDAIVVARLAAATGLPAKGAEPPAPLYLRAPDAKLPGGISPPPT